MTTKLPNGHMYNIPNGLKIFQMAITYINIFFSRPSKINPKLLFLVRKIPSGNLAEGPFETGILDQLGSDCKSICTMFNLLLLPKPKQFGSPSCQTCFGKATKMYQNQSILCPTCNLLPRLIFLMLKTCHKKV
jgi:hypothetical protein